MTLQIAAHRHIENLIRAPQLHIRLHGHGVVALQQGVEEFMQRDGGAAAVALGEIVFDVLSRGCAQQADHLGQIQPLQPLAVAAHLEPTRGFKIQ
jgi:hypothetical protein